MQVVARVEQLGERLQVDCQCARYAVVVLDRMVLILLVLFVVVLVMLCVLILFVTLVIEVG